MSLWYYDIIAKSTGAIHSSRIPIGAIVRTREEALKHIAEMNTLACHVTYKLFEGDERRQTQFSLRPKRARPAPPK